MPDTTIRAKALDGTWETIGVDRATGVWPEAVELTADAWGSKTASFDLRRDPKMVWPDIGAFTPIKVEVDGRLVWSGRVSETPSRDGADQIMTVACEGWQAHLDDDLYERKYVATRLSEWKDTRSFDTAVLTTYRQSGQVSSDRGITIGWPANTVLVNSTRCGVSLDLGPGNTAARIVVTYDWANATTNGNQLFTGSSTNDGAGTASPTSLWLVNHGTGSLTNQTQAVNVSGHRYINIGVLSSAGADFTPTGDLSVKIKTVQVFAETAYESKNTSILKASTVITDALDKATVLLSSDRSGVTVPAFSIPEYAPGEPRTPREAIEAVNAYHGYLGKVDVDGRFVWREQSGAPKFEVGDFSALELADSSQNSGQDIYNRVIVTGQDPAGAPVRVTRTAVEAFGLANAIEQTDLTISNPSFDTNATGWSATNGAVSRTTTVGEYDSSPGGGKLVPSAGFASATLTLSGTARAGRTYVMSARIKAGSSVLGGMSIGQTAALTGGAVLSTVTTSFQLFTCAWTPTVNTTNPVIAFGLVDPGGTINMFFDSITVQAGVASLADRRGFVRTKQLAVNSTLPSDGVAATAIGDTWLTQHATTPFRGTANLTGPTALRGRQSGQPIPLARLLTETGELIHFSDRKDPDTGDVGRDGRIAAVSYRPLTDEATITLDNQRNDAETWLSRLAVVTGGG